MVRPLLEVLNSSNILQAISDNPANFRFPKGASVVVAVEDWRPHAFVDVVEDGGPGRPSFTLKALRYTLVRPPDGAWGGRQANGSWSGMVGLVARKDVDIALGPFVVTESRASVVDFSLPLTMDHLRVMSLSGAPEMDPWAFLLPLRPMVWVATIATLLLAWVATVVMLKLWRTPGHTSGWNPFRLLFEHLRVLLQQNSELGNCRGWERLVFASWLLVTNVLMWSYSGNLMSLLAVRYVPHPIQTLADLITHPSLVAILEANTAYTQLLREVQDGTFHDLAALEEASRMIHIKAYDFSSALQRLLRGGNHAFIIENSSIEKLMAEDLSRTGHCDFYKSTESFLPSSMGLIAQKDTPLLPAINQRIRMLTESGLYEYWVRSSTPNSSVCAQLPSRITVKEPIGFFNIWGLFMVLASGLVLSTVVFYLEVLTVRCSGVITSSSTTTTTRKNTRRDEDSPTSSSRGVPSNTLHRSQPLSLSRPKEVLYCLKSPPVTK
ncbi:Glutamate receptor-like 57 [Homarus americanus]|uniref:Glutamate receptor-like 57 n=1 Tax=Homarus americanus TaxID=6706 RepID=A0A8J5K889_HOMAM|nr:Glutamate receptor-like 57 [Homarus americanus]